MLFKAPLLAAVLLALSNLAWAAPSADGPEDMVFDLDMRDVNDNSTTPADVTIGQICNGHFDKHANKCGGVCNPLVAGPRSCTHIPGTNCVQFHAQYLHRLTVCSKKHCNGPCTPLAKLKHHKNCHGTKDTCVGVPATQSIHFGK